MSGWWKTAKPGDRVVCVNDAWPNVGVSMYRYCPLEKGRVYEVFGLVSSSGYGPDGTLSDDVGILIQGLPNVFRGQDIGFCARRFRPVQTKSTETGMAILKRILNGAPVSEDA